jgi:hypothetical protein
MPAFVAGRPSSPCIRGREIGRGLLRKTIRDAGVDVDEFLERG